MSPQAVEALHLISPNSPTYAQEQIDLSDFVFADQLLSHKNVNNVLEKRSRTVTDNSNEDTYRSKRLRTQSFGNLATIANSSSSLVHAISDQSCVTLSNLSEDLIDPLVVFDSGTSRKRSPFPESTAKEAGYGWFVEMDDVPAPKTAVDAYASQNDSKANLAFSAAVAPCTHEKEEENELAWAEAADAVDDVLGDFF